MSPDRSRWPGVMFLSKSSGIVLLLGDDDVGSGNFDLAGSYHTKSKSETIKVQRTRGRWSHRTHQLCCNQPTTVERRSGGSVVDLAARPEGGVGDALRPPGVTFMAAGLVLAGAAPREAREKAAIGRRVRLAPLRPSSIRGAHGHRRRPAEAIELLSNSWARIDGRSGRVQEERSLVHLVEILTNWMISPNTSSSTTSIRDPFVPRRLV